MKTVSIVSGVLWATAIVAAAIVHAPGFLTLVLLPLLGFTALATMEIVRRRALEPSGAQPAI